MKTNSPFSFHFFQNRFQEQKKNAIINFVWLKLKVVYSLFRLFQSSLFPSSWLFFESFFEVTFLLLDFLIEDFEPCELTSER